MPDEIHLIEAAANTTAVIRSRVPRNELARFVPAACGEVWAFISAKGLPRPGRHVALYLGDGTVEVGAEVSAPFAGNDRVLCSQLPAGTAATTVYFGPYPGLGKVHGRVREWCTAHGHRLTGVSWEIYGHWEESWNTDPARIRTDIFYALQEPVSAG